MNAEVTTIDHDTQQPAEINTTTALAVVAQHITEINAVEATIAGLEIKYRGVVFDVQTTEGMKAARKAREEIREPRYGLQRLQKAAKAPLNNLKRAVDDQTGGLVGRLSVIEDPVHAQITGEEERKETERQQRLEAERQRVAAIEERITDIRESVTMAAGKSAAEIAEFLAALEAMAIDESFAEFKQRAEGAKVSTLARLRMAHTAAVDLEAEQKRLAEVRERLDREKAEQDAAAEIERQRVAAETAARELDRNRRSEIQGIQQQVVIAQIGRPGIRKGGTINCIRETLAETEKWVVTEENFGPMILEAQLAKSVALESIRALLTTAEKQAAEAKRLADEKAENDRVEQQRKAEREAGEKRLADQRAALERQEEALRVAQQPAPPSPEPDSVITAAELAAAPPASSPAVTVISLPPRWRPKDEAIIHVIATTFQASNEVATGWIIDVAARLARKSAERSEAVTA